MNKSQVYSYLDDQIDKIDKKIHKFQSVRKILLKTKEELMSILDSSDLGTPQDIPKVVSEVGISETPQDIPKVVSEVGISETPQSDPPTLRADIINPNELIDAFEDNFDMRAYIEKKRAFMIKAEQNGSDQPEPLAPTAPSEHIKINPLMRYTTTRQKYITYKLFQMAKKNIENLNQGSDVDKVEKINNEADRLMNLWMESEASGNHMFYIP